MHQGSGPKIKCLGNWLGDRGLAQRWKACQEHFVLSEALRSFISVGTHWGTCLEAAGLSSLKARKRGILHTQEWG